MTAHSVAQLELLHAAARRIRADAALTELQCTHVAVGAVMAKGNASAYDRLQRSLKERTQ